MLNAREMEVEMRYTDRQRDRKRHTHRGHSVCV